MYYIHKDHLPRGGQALGSVNVITDDNAAIIEEQSFDAWGRRRNPTNWTYTNVSKPVITDRGYTGHACPERSRREHLDQFNLINMNGRVYDLLIGRMLSPDITVQAPGNTQSYNRYSYCMNNPLKYTDPSGWFFGNTEGGAGEYTIFNDGAPNAADRLLWRGGELSNELWIMASSPGGSRAHEMLVSGSAHVYRYDYYNNTDTYIKGKLHKHTSELVRSWYEVEYRNDPPIDLLLKYFPFIKDLFPSWSLWDNGSVYRKAYLEDDRNARAKIARQNYMQKIALIEITPYLNIAFGGQSNEFKWFSIFGSLTITPQELYLTGGYDRTFSLSNSLSASLSFGIYIGTKSGITRNAGNFSFGANYIGIESGRSFNVDSNGFSFGRTGNVGLVLSTSPGWISASYSRSSNPFTYIMTGGYIIPVLK